MYSPENEQLEPENTPPGKGKSSSIQNPPPFLGFEMLVLGGL